MVFRYIVWADCASAWKSYFRSEQELEAYMLRAEGQGVELREVSRDEYLRACSAFGEIVDHDVPDAVAQQLG